MELSNVSSQGERCMMILIVDLANLVMNIAARASDMKKTSIGRTNLGGDEGM